jgi:hypothetical protein
MPDEESETSPDLPEPPIDQPVDPPFVPEDDEREGPPLPEEEAADDPSGNMVSSLALNRLQALTESMAAVEGTFALLDWGDWTWSDSETAQVLDGAVEALLKALSQTASPIMEGGPRPMPVPGWPAGRAEPRMEEEPSLLEGPALLAAAFLLAGVCHAGQTGRRQVVPTACTKPQPSGSPAP